MNVMIFDHMEECTEQEVQRMLPLVSAQRREQALRYKHTFGQYCCLKSWLMLYGLMDEQMNELMDEWSYNEHGKPSFKPSNLQKQPKVPTFIPYFSISHCKDGIAVAVDEQPIGIDIETIRKADEELIERVMNAEEQQRIRTSREPSRTFTTLWTQKEAIVKALGTGITSFEQLQNIRVQNTEYSVQTIEKEKYIYSIAYGKLHCIGA